MMRRVAIVVLAIATALALGVVSVRHAPFYLPELAPSATVEQDARLPVFGYATLTIPVVRLLVTGQVIPAREATLSGFRREGRHLVPDDGARVEGRLFEVDARALHRLDRYERLGTGYDRIEVELDGGQSAWIYLLIN